MLTVRLLTRPSCRPITLSSGTVSIKTVLIGVDARAAGALARVARAADALALVALAIEALAKLVLPAALLWAALDVLSNGGVIALTLSTASRLSHSPVAAAAAGDFCGCAARGNGPALSPGCGSCESRRHELCDVLLVRIMTPLAVEGAISCAIAKVIASEALAELEDATTLEIVRCARARGGARRVERREEEGA